jgi:hypothetical protein
VLKVYKFQICLFTPLLSDFQQEGCPNYVVDYIIVLAGKYITLILILNIF